MHIYFSREIPEKGDERITLKSAEEKWVSRMKYG
jgi:hypothetical protein